MFISIHLQGVFRERPWGHRPPLKSDWPHQLPNYDGLYLAKRQGWSWTWTQSYFQLQPQTCLPQTWGTGMQQFPACKKKKPKEERVHHHGYKLFVPYFFPILHTYIPLFILFCWFLLDAWLHRDCVQTHMSGSVVLCHPTSQCSSARARVVTNTCAVCKL